MSSPSTFRTNQRTKKKYPISNPLGSDLDRGRSKVEDPENSSDVQQQDQDSFSCVVCQTEKTGSHSTVNGEDCCNDCLRDYRSGRMQAEDAYQRAKLITSPEYPSAGGYGCSPNSYVKPRGAACLTCGKTNRAICLHGYCFEHRTCEHGSRNR